MKKGNVTSEKIHFSRSSRATDAEIKALAEDIRDNGLKHPILVDAHSGLLLDGLNRLRAYQMLGWSVVPALFFDTPSEAADELVKVRAGEPFPHQRNMELYVNFKVLCRAWDLRRRTGAKQRTKLPPIEGARVVCSRACGVSENSINRLNMLVNMANHGNHQAARIVGEIYASPPGSPIIGYERISAVNNAQRRMSPMREEERVEALTNIIKAADTALEQAFRIGGMHTLSPESRDAVKEKIDSLTKSVRLIVKELRREF
jgi:hypothetical protein